jgi:hypothetical protein
VSLPRSPTQKTPSTAFLVSASDTSITKPRYRRSADNRHRFKEVHNRGPRPQWISEILGYWGCGTLGARKSRYSSRRRVLFTVLQRNTSRQGGMRSLLRSSPHRSHRENPRPEPQLRRGTLAHVREIGRACKGLRVPIAYPTRSVPPRSAIGTPPNHCVSESSVRLFMVRTLTPLPLRLIGPSLARRCGKDTTQEQVRSAPVGIN